MKKSRISVAGALLRGGSLLLGKRYPGTSIGLQWEFPGGKAEEGETTVETLRREYREELGIEISPGKCFYVGEFSNRNIRYELLAFWVEILSGDFSFKQHQALGWFSVEELDVLPMAGSDRQIADCITGLFIPSVGF